MVIVVTFSVFVTSKYMLITELKMEIFDTTHSSVVPVPSYYCFGDYCYNLFFESVQLLQKDRINIVTTSFCVRIPQNCVLVHRDAKEHKKWRVLNTFLYPDPHTKKITFSLIVENSFFVQPRMHLMHIELVKINECVKQIKGKKVKNYKIKLSNK